MADIQRLPSELEVGVFSDNLLSTQLDTQERVNSLFADFNVPDIQYSEPIIPKNWNTDDILKSPDLPKREDYLTSDDPKLRELAKSAMAQDAAGNKALTKKFGMPNMVRYQEGQEKFTDDHWWSESGKTKYGFNPYKSLAENEAFYHDNVWNNYSLLGKTWRGVGTFAGRVLSKVVTGLVGMVGDIGSMMWNGLEEAVEAGGGPKNNFWTDVSDNWLARTMEEADDYVKQQILPVYKSLNYDNKGVMSKLFDPTFWMTDISDGAGFLLQFAVPGTMFGKAAMLGKAGKLGRFGKVMAAGVGETATASRLSKGIGSGLEFLTGSRNVGGISAHVFNTTMESVAETKEGFKNTVNDLLAKGYSQHEAEQIAAENAPQQFGLNMAILSVSNAFENKWFQQSIGNRLNPLRASINDAGLVNVKPGNWVGKFFANTTAGNRIYHYGGNGIKAAIMEGYWEENAQLAAQRISRGEYTRKGDNTPDSGRVEKTAGFLKQLMKQTVDASKGNDREAADSIMAGVVIGVLGGAAFSKFSGTRDELRLIDGNVHATKNLDPKDAGKGEVIKKKTFLPEGERRQRQRDNALVVAQVKNAQDGWLSISSMPDGLYNEDHTINEEKAAAKVVEINEKLAKIGSVVHRRATLENITDPVERENLQYLLFGDYVKAHILNGTGEALVDRLSKWGNQSKEVLESYGVNTDMIEDPVHWSNVAQDMLNEYKKIDTIRFVNNTNETATGYAQKERAIKSIIFDYIANKQAAKTVASRYLDLQIENDPFNEIDEFNSYNKMIAWKGTLENTLKNGNLDQDSAAHFKSELDELNNQIEMRKKSLPEHKVGSTGMIFEVGSNTQAKENKIFETVNEYLAFKYGREDAQRAVEAFDGLINKYSNPENGIKNWNDTVEFYEAERKKLKLAKLTDLKYSKEDIDNMTPEEQDVIIATGKVNEKAPETSEKKDEEKEDKEPTLEELRQVVSDILKQYDPTLTTEGVDEAAIKFVTIMKNQPELMDTLDDDKRAEFQVIQQYVEMKVAATKQAVAKEEAKESTETQPVTAADPVVIVPSSPAEPIIVESAKPEEEKVDEINITQEEEPAHTKSTLLDLVREAYRLHEQAIENDTTFKEEAEKENMRIHNNKVDDHVDSGKTTGNITLITSNPNDLKNNRLNDDNNNVSRFNFLDNLLSGKLDKNNFKMTLGLSEKGNIFGIVANTQGTPVKFDERGMPHDAGLPILFYLDYDMFTTQNINKRRSDVVAPPFKLAPLATSPGVAGKNDQISFAPPLEIHRSFVDRDVIEMIKDRIRRTTVTASIDFVTQGLLFREGTTNSYAAIPKNAPTYTASDLFEKGHIRDEKGEIHLDDVFLSGVYRRAHRIQFPMLKNLNRKSDGAEIAEFRPLALKDVTNEEGKKIVDILKAANGENFFEAAVSGNLESTKENITTLTSLLRPDKFLILNLGTNILVINAKRFKKLMQSDDITIDKLRSITKVEDLLNTEINMTKTFYDNNDEVELLPGILGEGRNNYSRFINRNVVTSTKPLTKTSETEGYARINKRIALTLDENMDDMIKAINQKEQENKAPEITEVQVLTEAELSESEKKSAIFTPINPDVEENLDDDFTNTDC